MTAPIGKSRPEEVEARCTMARAATCRAGSSIKPSAEDSEPRRARTSRSSDRSPAHAPRRKVSRSAGGRSSADWSRASTFFHVSGCIGASSQFPVEPEFGGAPVALDSDGRDAQNLSRFFYAEATEKTHLDDLS